MDSNSIHKVDRAIAGERCQMADASSRMNKLLVAFISLALICPATIGAQDKSPDSKAKSDAPAAAVHLTLVVTAGEDKQPVDSASVYVRFVEARTLSRNKKVEMNLKTNLSGICHVPEIPSGKVLIQVIAPGWKTYGEYFDVDQAEQTINISLVRPPKWY
jgi:hypothetical protein